MNNEQHALVLNAYLSRLTLADIENVLKAQNQAWHNSLNYGLSAQVESQKKACMAIYLALSAMLDSDKKLIEIIIHRAIN